jgi:hypothetical protein
LPFSLELNTVPPASVFGIKEKLDGLFGKPEEYGEGPVKPLYDLAAGQVLFRARLMGGEHHCDLAPFAERLGWR